jgi:hypothetical protein
MKSQQGQNPSGNIVEANDKKSEKQCQPACPACGGSLIDIRAKLQCTKCHRICETCCEGGRG